MSAHAGPADASQGRQDGSAVVIALALAAVMLVVTGASAGRVVSATSGAAGMLKREQARTLAEHTLVHALAELDAGVAAGAVRRGAPFDAHSVRTVAPDATTGLPGATLTVSITTAAGREHDPRQLLRVDVVADIGSASHMASATVRPLLSIDHLLFSEYEVVDPALRQEPRASCAATRAEGDRAVGCISTVIGPGVLDGPVHSNDAITLAPGVTVTSELTTSHLARTVDGRVGPALWGGEVAGAPVGAPFGLGHRSELSLPRETRTVRHGASVTCRLRGPTLLRFDGPRVRITSPRSVARVGETVPDGASSADAIGCLGLDRATFAGVAVVHLPHRAVIEVVRDDVTDCVDHPLGLATGEDTERDWWCTGGDAFVWGRYSGARTVIAEDNVQIVWDLEPGDAIAARPADYGDLLGLVAGDSVVLRRPVGRPIRRTAPYGLNLAFAGAHTPPFGAHPLDAPNDVATTWDSPSIVAALAALRGSITIQNPFRGQLHPGPLRVEGSLAGRFRGVLSWEERNSSGALLATMGYPVELTYDRRLTTTAPPAMPLTGDGTIRILELDVG